MGACNMTANVRCTDAQDASDALFYMTIRGCAPLAPSMQSASACVSASEELGEGCPRARVHAVRAQISRYTTRATCCKFSQVVQQDGQCRQG